MKKDSRYQKTETAILTTLAKILEENPRLISLNPSDLARQANISLSTFYRHYDTIEEMLIVYESRLALKFESSLHFRRVKTLKNSMQFTLVFIIKYKKFFKIAFRRGDQNLLRRIFESLKPKIIASCHWTKNQDQLFDICFYELYGLLEDWSEGAFKEKDIASITNNIIYLLKSAPARLKGVIWHSWHASAKDL